MCKESCVRLPYKGVEQKRREWKQRIEKRGQAGSKGWYLKKRGTENPLLTM